MSLPFRDVLLFKTKYRLAQQYSLEAVWLEILTLQLQSQVEFYDAVEYASQECGF
jgi:hypothetical protein